MKNRLELRVTIGRSSALVAFFSILSPIAGLALEMIMAWRFGSSAPVDAYRAAYLLISFGSLVASFLLPHLVIPAVTRLRAEGRELDGWRVAFTVGYLLIPFGLILLIYALIDPLAVFALLAPGLKAIPRSGAAYLLGACSFALVTTLCCGILAGLLQTYQSFGVPSVSQMLFNLSICFVIALAGKPEGSISIAVGVTVGSVLMLGLHILALIRIATRIGLPLNEALRPTTDRGTLKQLMSGYPLLFILLCSILTNLVLTRQLSHDGSGALAQFGYAMKLMIVTGIAPTALATVIFPSLAIAHAELEPQKLTELTSRAIKMTLLLTGPLGIFMFVYRGPIVDLMFNRGSMSTGALEQIKLDLAILLLQAVPGNLNILLQKLSFALHDTRASAFFSGLGLVVLAIFLGPMSAKFGSAGVILLYSVVQGVVPIGLLLYQSARFQVVSMGTLVKSAALVTLLCAGVGGCSVLVRSFFTRAYTIGIPYVVLELAVGFAAALVAAIVFSRLLRIAEMNDLETLLWSSFRRFAGSHSAKA